MQRCMWLMNSMQGQDLADVLWAVCMYAAHGVMSGHVIPSQVAQASFYITAA